jgi:hypothetical protein
VPDALEQTDQSAASDHDVLAVLTRLRLSVEVMRRDAVTPRARDRARLILKEVRALERDFAREDPA